MVCPFLSRSILCAHAVASLISNVFLRNPRLFALAAALLTGGWLPKASAAEEYVEGEVIVTFKSSIDLSTGTQTLGKHGLGLAKHFPLLSQHRSRHTGLVRMKGRHTADLIAELKTEPTVESAEPNYIRHIYAQPPNDPLFGQLWGLRNTGQSVNGVTGSAGGDIKFMNAWALAQTTATTNVVVGVIDTGVDYNHPDLAANIWINTAETPGNGVDDDGDGYIDDIRGWDFAGHLNDPSDSGEHGTHVSGTIAAVGNNALGVAGVCYAAKIMALKASSDGNSLDDAAIIEALQYATAMKVRGVNVVAINASFGGPGYDSAMAAAIQAAGDAGIVFCAAAGNDSANNDTTMTYPAGYRLSNMIVVAASDQNDNLASFSSYGATTVDLAAPGVNILSTIPTNMAGTLATVQFGATTHTANEITYSGRTAGVTGAVYDCGLGYPTNFPPQVSGNIALISRGTLFFSEKVSNAMAAGARAAVIYNNASGNFLGTLSSPSNWIPALSLSQADGLAIKTSLPGTGTVVNIADPAKIYQLLNGTSMATPHVSGAVAFAALNFPNETVQQRVQRVIGSADSVPALIGKVQTGGRLNLQRIVDSDANGLPDWWEQRFLGHLTGTDPGADEDHDGASNLAEWLAGTNPADAASNLRLHAQASVGSPGPVVSWPSVAGKVYRLERSTNLLSGFNSVVRSNILATPPLNTETDSAVGFGNSRFYRLTLEQ